MIVTAPLCVIRRRKFQLKAIASILTFSILQPTLADAEPIKIEEITVIGQKISRSLQGTKESIAVTTAETIETRNLVNISDVINQTAGVSGSELFQIRGISSGRTDTLRTELASLYIDGVALSGWGKTEGPRQLWDVEQVEIMRGPQSTNLGRNSLAGAIVVKTMDPAYENTATLRLGAGNYGSQEFKGVANVSLKEGVSALRLVYEQSKTDGFVNNITRNEDDADFREQENIRVKWLLQPSDDLRAVFAVQYTDNAIGEPNLAFAGAGYDRDDRITLGNVRGERMLKSLQASAIVDYQINNQWKLRSISSAMDAERERTDDFDNLASNGGIIQRNADDKNFSQELRFNFEEGQVRSSSGIYYSKIKSSNNNDTDIVLDLEPLFNGFSPGLGTTFIGFGVYPAFYDLATGGNTTIETTNLAIFTEWEYEIDDHWRLSFGARYDQEDQKAKVINLGSSSVTLPNPADWAVLGPAGQGAIGLLNAQLSALSTNGALSQPDSDYDAFLPHIGITYKLNANISMSLFAKRGYRSGGTEVTGLNTINPYDPEYLDNYEFAFRSSLFDGRGIFNVNIYKSYWKDQQVGVPEAFNNNVFTIIRNAGESELYGLETEFQFQVNHNFSIFATAGYSNTEYTRFTDNTNDYSGNEFIQAPKVTAAIGAYYTSERGFFVGVNLTHQGKSYADTANTIELESYNLVNLNAGFQGVAFKVETFANNLFDDGYATARFQTFGRMGKPRTYGARVTWTI